MGYGHKFFHTMLKTCKILKEKCNCNKYLFKKTKRLYDNTFSLSIQYGSKKEQIEIDKKPKKSRKEFSKVL